MSQASFPSIPVESVDPNSQAYLSLGLGYLPLGRLVTSANHLITKIPRCGNVATVTSIQATVLRLAQSAYVATKNRQPCILEAAQGGAFAPETQAFITDYSIFFTQGDVRRPLALIAYLNKMDFGQQPEEGLTPSILNDLLHVGTICAAMPSLGFDQTYDRRIAFKEAGSLAAILTSRIFFFSLFSYFP